MLLIVESHPVQYHAPVYRCLFAEIGLSLNVIYGSKKGVEPSLDEEFGVHTSWDVDLTTGYPCKFLTDQTLQSMLGIFGRVRNHVPPARALLVPGYGQRLDRWALVSATAAAVPVIFRGEATDHAKVRSRVKSFVRDMILRLLYSRVSAFAAIGTRARSHYLRLGADSTRIVESPYCVDEAVFRDAANESVRMAARAKIRAALSIPPDAFVVMFSGKLSPRKGPDILLSALQTLPEAEQRKFALLFVGEGELRDELERTAGRSTFQTARFTGFRNQTELSPYFMASDALALLSRWGETWGLVVNEALMHGLPVVVSGNVGCAPDLVAEGKTGFVVDETRPQDVGGALLQLRDLARGGCARDCRRVVSNYTVHHAARGIEAAYRLATGNSG